MQIMRIALNAEKKDILQEFARPKKPALPHLSVIQRILTFLPYNQRRRIACRPQLYGHNAEALMDSGFSGSFVDTDVCKKN